MHAADGDLPSIKLARKPGADNRDRYHKDQPIFKTLGLQGIVDGYRSGASRLQRANLCSTICDNPRFDRQGGPRSGLLTDRHCHPHTHTVYTHHTALHHTPMADELLL